MEPRQADAAATLAQLERDRDRLVSTTRTPWWVPTAIGLIVGLWVGSPALASARVSYGTAVVAVVLVLAFARRQTGVQASARGPRVWALGALWLLVTLLAYSVSLGLAAADMPVWIAVPAAIAGAVTYLHVRLIDRWAREGLRP